MAIDTENLADMPRDGAGIRSPLLWLGDLIMPRDGAGMAAALGALDVEGKLDEEPSQDDLFASSPLFGADAALMPARGRGRPPGALNHTTEAWRSFWLKNYRSPLLWLGDLITADPVQLLKAIRRADASDEDTRAISLLDVIALQKSAAEAIAPYVHRKQPIAIDVGEDAKVPLFQQLVIDGATFAGMMGMMTKSAENAGETPSYTPVLEGEVAAEKSQNAGEGEPSA